MNIHYCGYDKNGKYFEFDIPIEQYAEWYDKNSHLINPIRPNDCIINTMFSNSTNPDFYRSEYCAKNCQFRCQKGLDYKKGNNA